MDKLTYTWYPHSGFQTDFCKAWQDEVLAGGAAGPGKTDCLVMEATRYLSDATYHALLARRTFPMLQEIIDRTRRFYPALGGDYRAGEHRWYFPSGAKISLGHCQNDGDEYNYQGKEYAFIGLDEAGQFLPNQILYLFSRLRSTSTNLPKRMRYASNPGGPSHQFLKDRFRIQQYPAGGVTFYEDVEIDLETIRVKETISRIFVPGRLTDNPTLIQNDPGYVARLMQLPELERMRLLHGVWDAFEGQVFIELNADIHCLDWHPDDIPPEWTRFRSFDWGYSAPFSVGWWAMDFDGRLYRYREWYGAKMDEAKHRYVGLRMNASEIARGIREREEHEAAQGIKVNIGPADPAIWNKRRDPKSGQIGISVAEEMQGEGLVWIKANNDRVPGRQQLHSRLRPDDAGKPRIYILKGCSDWWRTIPQLHEYERNPEDVDQSNDIEDHIYDETRYALMSRPLRPHAQQKSDVGTFRGERRRYLAAKQFASRRGISIEEAYRSIR
jgi:hypothetical protein